MRLIVFDILSSPVLYLVLMYTSGRGTAGRCANCENVVV